MRAQTASIAWIVSFGEQTGGGPGRSLPSFLDQPLRRQGKPLRVLVVEDDALVAMDYQAIVSELGGDVVATADCADDALRSAQDLQPDLVLMDVRLKGDIDGIEAAQSIQRRLRIPVVFVTGHGDPHTTNRIRALVGADPVLKPISVARLRRAILRACEGYDG